MTLAARQQEPDFTAPSSVPHLTPSTTPTSDAPDAFLTQSDNTAARPLLLRSCSCGPCDGVAGLWPYSSSPSVTTPTPSLVLSSRSPSVFISPPPSLPRLVSLFFDRCADTEPQSLALAVLRLRAPRSGCAALLSSEKELCKSAAKCCPCHSYTHIQRNCYLLYSLSSLTQFL